MRRITSGFLLFVALTAALAPSFTAPAAWASEFAVNTYTGASAYLTRGRSIARAQDGTFMVVWSALGGQDGDGGTVLGRFFDSAGAAKTGEFVVNTYTRSDQCYPAVAVDGLGQFVVVWESLGQDGSQDGVFGQRFDSDGDPVDLEFQVNTNTTGFQNDVVVAADSVGRFVVAWESFAQDGSSDGVFAQRYDADGDRIGTEFQVNTYTSERQDTGDVALLADGEFVIVWESNGQDGDGFGIFGQRFDSDGARLGSEFQVNTYTTYRQDDAAVAADAAGNFVVTWGSTRQDSFSNGVFARMFLNNGTPSGSEFQVNTQSIGPQDNPSIARQPSGEFVITWESFRQDGDHDGVFAQRFDAAGARVGNEFRANTYTASSQDDPSVAADPSGAFVIAWESQGQSSSNDDVFARVFLPDVVTTTTSTIPPTTLPTTTVSSSTLPSTTTTTTTLDGATTTTVEGASRCGNPVGTGSEIGANDALFILRAAVGLASGVPCECDIDASGSIVALDALQDLRVAVGHPITLHCPPCE